MCRAVACRVRGNTTWAGCGEHIQSVQQTVPASQWCNGKHTSTQITAGQTKSGGFFARLFGR